jgi:hypothetical protein
MFFYKYCHPGDLQFGMLCRGEIFFASPTELNKSGPQRLDRFNRLSDQVARVDTPQLPLESPVFVITAFNWYEDMRRESSSGDPLVQPCQPPPR